MSVTDIWQFLLKIIAVVLHPLKHTWKTYRINRTARHRAIRICRHCGKVEIYDAYVWGWEHFGAYGRIKKNGLIELTISDENID